LGGQVAPESGAIVAALGKGMGQQRNAFAGRHDLTEGVRENWCMVMNANAVLISAKGGIQQRKTLIFTPSRADSEIAVRASFLGQSLKA